MRLLGQPVLQRFARKHADAGAWINTWITAVIAAAWQNIDDVRKAYPHADGVKIRSGTVVTIFNCKGNEYRLLTIVAYPIQAVQVLEVLTHGEYSKGFWKARY